MKADIDALNAHYTRADARTLLDDFLKAYRGRIALATSFGAEDQVVTDMIAALDKTTRIFTLDTGRLNEETYEVMERTRKRYGIEPQVFFPHPFEIENLYRVQGVNGFRESVEYRKECCRVRKLNPLRRALEGLDVWITGLRRSQSPTRETMRMIEWDERHQLIKLNPLIEWDETSVWDYIRQHRVPYNALHDRGYPSIGCAPCTRAVREGEGVRDGRWWWENPEHKECGLHFKGGKDEPVATDRTPSFVR